MWQHSFLIFMKINVLKYADANKQAALYNAVAYAIVIDIVLAHDPVSRLVSGTEITVPAATGCCICCSWFRAMLTDAVLNVAVFAILHAIFRMPFSGIGPRRLEVITVPPIIVLIQSIIQHLSQSLQCKIMFKLNALLCISCYIWLQSRLKTFIFLVMY